MQMYGNFEGFPLNAPQKTNVEPESTPLEKEKHLQTTIFWVPAVSFRGCIVHCLGWCHIMTIGFLKSITPIPHPTPQEIRPFNTAPFKRQWWFL